MEQALLYLRLLRVSNWIKNLLVFAPLFFAKALWQTGAALDVTLAALAFCFISSTAYILNDLADYEQDKKHPHKKVRPIAAGLITRRQALGALAALLVIDALFVFFLPKPAASMLLLYALLNILYSFYLKHVAIVDILLVSSFYVLRVLTGGFAAAVPVSSWLIMTTIFLALLLVLGKRKSEFNRENRRPVLAQYSESFLDVMLSIAAALTIVSYSLYILIVHPAPFAVYTIFLVLLGIMRYLQLVYNGRDMESPEKIVWQDRTILLSIACWIIFMYFIFYSASIA